MKDQEPKRGQRVVTPVETLPNLVGVLPRGVEVTLNLGGPLKPAGMDHLVRDVVDNRQDKNQFGIEIRQEPTRGPNVITIVTH